MVARLTSVLARPIADRHCVLKKVNAVGHKQPALRLTCPSVHLINCIKQYYSYPKSATPAHSKSPKQPSVSPTNNHSGTQHTGRDELFGPTSVTRRPAVPTPQAPRSLPCPPRPHSSRSAHQLAPQLNSSRAVANSPNHSALHFPRPSLHRSVHSSHLQPRSLSHHKPPRRGAYLLVLVAVQLVAVQHQPAFGPLVGVQEAAALLLHVQPALAVALAQVSTGHPAALCGQREVVRRYVIAGGAFSIYPELCCVAQCSKCDSIR